MHVIIIRVPVYAICLIIVLSGQFKLIEGKHNFKMVTF